ncbi:hypothetical protein FA13DRAFT_1726266 [Coprinellus micaceus]|uniref:Uncharacterized protein n=1 Tax=Coprinellus micaceus TaxID=71717 RepID=A0A4Y7TT19_COPMI|nr:hypothetical protein FA13DRAFT_1726266 [Coprinellus micaceus]
MVDLRLAFPPWCVFEASFNRSLRRVWEDAPSVVCLLWSASPSRSSWTAYVCLSPGYGGSFSCLKPKLNWVEKGPSRRCGLHTTASI